LAPATGANREGATIRLIRKPEDVSSQEGWKPVEGFRGGILLKAAAWPFFLFQENRMHSKFNIVAPDQAIAGALQQKIDQKTKPLGSLGQLEILAKKIGLIQQRLDPEFDQPHLLVFAGDHGAAKAGVSAFPQDVTWQMVENFLSGGAAINVFARQNDMHLAIIDAGVAHDFGRRNGLINAKIAAGTANYLEQPAMTREQCAQAIERGAEISRNLSGNGCNVVGFGEMGIGNTASASLMTHCLTGVSLAECVGRGTGLDDAGLARKQALLEQALTRYRSADGSDEPLAVLAEFGGFEIAMMVGAMLGAAEAKMLLLIDGFIVSAAALTATKLYPALTEYCVFCHRSAEPGHQAQLQAMQAEALLDLGLRLGEGTGAALAYPLVQAAAGFLSEMASFASAGVADRT
jgi:nicotinate-nucleotide--dimethylbenzimidazole phosphoribosyltransferase